MGQCYLPFWRAGTLREALWVFSLGSFDEPIAGLQGRIPLQHPPFATLTVVAIAVGNRQFDITHNVPCSAMRTSKADVMAKLAAHLCTIWIRRLTPKTSLIAFGSPLLGKTWSLVIKWRVALSKPPNTPLCDTHHSGYAGAFLN
jgi:hypothetical protein